MFKKFAALSTAVFIVAAGLSTVAISAANAVTADLTVTTRQSPFTGLNPTSGLLGIVDLQQGDWTPSSPTWSPAVPSGQSFAACTVYQEAITLTASSTTFPAITTSTFTVTGGGANPGTTITATPQAAGGTTASVVITYPATSGCAPVLSTTSTISNGALNPHITITSDTDFGSTSTSNWTLGAGTTGLSLMGIGSQGGAKNRKYQFLWDCRCGYPNDSGRRECICVNTNCCKQHANHCNSKCNYNHDNNDHHH